MPADAVKFWRWRTDGQKDWAALETMIGNISPAILSSLNAAISMANASAQQKDPSFDFRKNLIGNLGDDFVGYQKAAAGTSIADLNNAPSIFLFAAANPEQALQAVRSVASMLYGRQDAADPRDFLGKKIYSIALPAARVAGAAASPRYLYLATSGGYVAISGDSSIVENYLRSTGAPTKPLRETAGLADAAAAHRRHRRRAVRLRKPEGNHALRLHAAEGPVRQRGRSRLDGGAAEEFPRLDGFLAAAGLQHGVQILFLLRVQRHHHDGRNRVQGLRPRPPGLD